MSLKERLPEVAKEIECPNGCPAGSFTIKIVRHPELEKWRTYSYQVTCNECGQLIETIDEIKET